MIRKLKSELLTSIRNKKINVFIIFLLLSFVILIFTKLSKTYTNTILFSIEKINVPQENIILKDSAALSITLKTYGFKWLNYYFSKPKIVIDFSKDVYKKDHFFVWSKSEAYLNNTQFNKQVEILNINPDTLYFRYGLNMVKKVPVKLKTDITCSPGYDIYGAYVLEPDSVVVVGPNVIVSKIQFLNTNKIFLKDVRTNINQSIPIKLPKQSKDITVSNTSVTLKAKVEKFTEGTLKIPIQVINVPQEMNLKFFPKEVSVSYYVSLKDYINVTAKDFEVVCDYLKIKDNQSALVPEVIRFPKTVKNVKINQQRIDFIINK